jgi:hypothetical protein
MASAPGVRLYGCAGGIFQAMDWLHPVRMSVNKALRGADLPGLPAATGAPLRQHRSGHWTRREKKLTFTQG